MPRPRARLSPFALSVLAALSLPAMAPCARAQATLPSGFEDQLVSGALSVPAGMAFLPDRRLLVVEQLTAAIRMLPYPGYATPVDVGTLTGVTTGGERGLLGIAIDPRWPAFPYVYVHHTATGSRVTVARYRLTGDVAGTGNGVLAVDTTSRYELIADAPDVASNHNGGTVRFGWDGMLYASFGEDANRCTAQDTTTLRGVILRLDVTQLPDGSGRAPRALVIPSDNPFVAHPDSNARLVWAYGLRNPFRFQPDMTLHELIVSDVGENTWEEVDRVPSGGLDFGWPFREGPLERTTVTCPGIVRPALTEPIFAYDRAQVNNGPAVAITAGSYRAPAGATQPFPAAYTGDIFVSDYYAGFMWRLEGAGNAWAIAAPVPGQPAPAHWAEGLESVSDYVVGWDGALWYCKQSGQIRRIVSVAAPPDTTVGPPRFSSAYPLPADGIVRFDVVLTSAARAVLSIHDSGGRRVRRFDPIDRAAGPWTPTWDGRDDAGKLLRSGIYFAKLEVGGARLERRVVIVR